MFPPQVRHNADRPTTGQSAIFHSAYSGSTRSGRSPPGSNAPVRTCQPALVMGPSERPQNRSDSKPVRLQTGPTPNRPDSPPPGTAHAESCALYRSMIRTVRTPCSPILTRSNHPSPTAASTHTSILCQIRLVREVENRDKTSTSGFLATESRPGRPLNLDRHRVLNSNAMPSLPACQFGSIYPPPNPVPC